MIQQALDRGLDGSRSRPVGDRQTDEVSASRQSTASHSDYALACRAEEATDFAGSSARREAFRTGIIARVPASNRPIGHAGSGRLIESRKFTIPEAVGAYRGALFSPLNRTVSSRQRTARYRPASTAATSAATTWPPASLR